MQLTYHTQLTNQAQLTNRTLLKLPAVASLSRYKSCVGFGRGAARADYAQETPTQSHASPSIQVYEEKIAWVKSTATPWFAGDKAKHSEFEERVISQLRLSTVIPWFAGDNSVNRHALVCRGHGEPQPAGRGAVPLMTIPCLAVD